MDTHHNVVSRSVITIVKSEAGLNDSAIRKSALTMLEETSRTFFVPISQLPSGLLEAVGSGYLCMRAIDEIEDHSRLNGRQKADLLRNISRTIQSSGLHLRAEDLQVILPGIREHLPEVSVRLPEWLALAPANIAHRIWDATATMADRMADWAEENFKVCSEADLDRYTMSVAGAVGLMLSDLWAWYDGTQTNRGNAIGFGRGLQSVNILRNRQEDLARGVDFFPEGWDASSLVAYSRKNLALADAYLAELPPGPALDFCRMPLILAYATLDALESGRQKLDRSEVMKLLGQSS